MHLHQFTTKITTNYIDNLCQKSVLLYKLLKNARNQMGLKEKIEELRSKLNIIFENSILETKEILKLSQELDILILEYQKTIIMQT